MNGGLPSRDPTAGRSRDPADRRASKRVCANLQVTRSACLSCVISGLRLVVGSLPDLFSVVGRFLTAEGGELVALGMAQRMPEGLGFRGEGDGEPDPRIPPPLR